MSAKQTLIAFHGDPVVKAKYLGRVAAHRQADELVKGLYWEKGKGCAVGCTIHGNRHDRYEAALGIPEALAQLEDVIFERLPNADAIAFPERFLSAPEVGADLSLVWPRFAVWLLSDPDKGVIRFAGKRADVRAAVVHVATLWQRVIDGESIESLRSAFASAAAAANKAAEAAAGWAAEAAAGWAAEAAASAAAGWAAAEAEAEAEAATAANKAAAAHWRSMADKLVELMAAAPVVGKAVQS